MYGFVTLTQSLLVLKDIFPHNLPSSYIQHEMVLSVYYEFKDRSDDGKHQDKSCDGEHCFLQFEKFGFNFT